jgi:hypothetical protein
MYQLIMLFFRIALFKQGPQDVPASPWVLRLVLPVYLAVNYLILLVNGTSSTALLQIGVDLTMMAGFIWPLLYFAGKSARLQQTFSAMVGTDAVINFAAIPAIASLNSQPSELALLLMLAMMAWHWLVSGHILRNALDRSWFFGLGLALLYIMLSSQLMAALFPEIVSNPQ